LDLWPHPQLQAWYALPTVQDDAQQMVLTAYVL
jgi:hypothetical protein